MDGRIDSTCGTRGRAGAVVQQIREGVVVGVLRGMINRRGFAVGTGVGTVGGTRGSGAVKGWRRVGGRAVVTEVEGTINRWMGTTRRAGSDILRWSMAESEVGWKEEEEGFLWSEVNLS